MVCKVPTPALPLAPAPCPLHTIPSTPAANQTLRGNVTALGPLLLSTYSTPPSFQALIKHGEEEGQTWGTTQLSLSSFVTPGKLYNPSGLPFPQLLGGTVINASCDR